MAVSTWTTEGSIAKLLAWRVAEAPEADFVYVEDDGPWSFAAIAARRGAPLRATVRRRRGAPRRPGVVRLGNDERFPAAAFATWMAGAGVIAMHPSAPAHDVADVAESMAAKAVSPTPTTPMRTQPDPAGRRRTPGGAGRHRRTPLLEQHFVAPDAVDGTDTALVLLTSGSTGKPKGVVLTHDNAWVEPAGDGVGVPQRHLAVAAVEPRQAAQPDRKPALAHRRCRPAAVRALRRARRSCCCASSTARSPIG